MRILVLNWKDMAHPHAGGAEVYTHEVTRVWASEGHEVTWFCAAVEGQPSDEIVEGVRIVRRGGRFGVYRAARRWYAEHGRGNFDLVIDEVNTKPFGAIGWVDDAPVIALIHQVCREIWWQEMPLPVAALGRFYLEGRWLRAYKDSAVLTVSESSRESLLAYGLRDVTVVPEGIGPLRRPEVGKEKDPTVIFVGRLAANKRPGEAIAAFRLLALRRPSAQMWVVGDGPERQRLERAAPATVTFHGRVGEDIKHALMARAHVLAVTSVREGWGLVVDEAAAVGTPTVAYDVPGLRDSTRAAGGVLVAPSPEALAAGLDEALGRPTAADGWAGGAVAWPDVAAAVLAAASTDRVPQ